MQYYSKPVMVKAIQYTGDNYDHVISILSLNNASAELVYLDKDNKRVPKNIITETRVLAIQLGEHEFVSAHEGDWIILNDESGVYPIPDEFFKQFYVKNPSEISDGYHTFNELYQHRILIYMALCKNVVADHPVWRSKVHSDDSVWDGWFILGINKAHDEQITYHLPIALWDDCFFAETLDKAPTFDGHSSDDVLERLKTL